MKSLASAKSSCIHAMRTLIVPIVFSLIAAKASAADYLYLIGSKGGGAAVIGLDSNGASWTAENDDTAITCLANDTAGNLLIANGGTLESDGYVRRLGANALIGTLARFNGNHVCATALASGDDGSLYAATTAGFILKFLPNGSSSQFASGFGAFWGLTFSGGNLYVGAGNTIQRIDAKGNSTLFAQPTLASPTGLVSDRSGNFYVADSSCNTIVRIDSYGASSVFASSGLHNPAALTIDSDGTLYALNAGDGTIVQFDAVGNSAIFAPGMGGGCLAASLLPISATQTVPSAFAYTTNNDTISISGYNGVFTNVSIPSTIGGLPVTRVSGFWSMNVVSVTIPDSVNDIGIDSFTECPVLSTVTIGTNVTNIGDYAFAHCRILSTVTIGNSVTNIGSGAFSHCPALSCFTMPNAVESIGSGAFSLCINLNNIIIPSSLTNIGVGAFWRTPVSFSVDANNPAYCSISGALFNKSQTLLLQYPGNNGQSCYAIPCGVTNVADYAFYSCSSLTNVLMPYTVTSIGSSSFNSCTNLPSIVIPCYVSSIGSGAFANCTALTNVYFQGNAPPPNGIFTGSPVTVYCNQGTVGWGTTFDGAPVIVIAPPLTPPSIATQPQGALVKAYAPASFSAVALGTFPLSYQWTLNGANLVGSTSSSLSIQKVTQADLGAYAVVVTNSYGAITSAVANLTMYPYLATPFIGVDTFWGFTNVLNAGTWGSSLAYQWCFNGTPIANATNQTLMLTSVQFTNAGLYSVVVTSPNGSLTNGPAQVVVNPAGISLGLAPTVTVNGVVGYNYIIQSSPDLSNTNAWSTLAKITLTQPVHLWVDTNTDASLPVHPRRFYRVLPGQ